MRRGLIAALLLALIPLSANAETLNINSAKAIELSAVQSSLRIVALANGAAEIVSSLGFRKNLVGRDIASSAPELKSVPIVTAGHQVISEKIIALKPNLVIIDAATGPKSAIELLRSAKLKIVSIPQAWNLPDMYKKVSAIAMALNSKAAGISLIGKMKSAIQKSNIGWKPRVIFLYLRGPSSIYLIGGKGSGADSVITALGGIDVGAATLKRPFNPLSAESVLSARPDVILVMSKGLQSVGGEIGLRRLPGLANAKKILAVDDSLLLSFGPRTPSLIGEMAVKLKALK